MAAPARPALAFVLLLAVWLVPCEAPAREWHFDVSVDGIPVGTYDISLQESGDSRSAKSDMRLGLSLLGFEAGRYEQHAEESWQADCLTRIDTRTVEKGGVTTIAGRLEAGGFVVDGPRGQEQLPRCAMSFAYWNPRVLKQTNLINVQTGAWTAVSVQALGQEPYSVRGTPIEASHYRIDTARNRIEVWYSDTGEWVGLRSTTRDGHVLAYRLK
ncbi:MAG: DUF6134 family protein [Steroidobacterales bacterium]